MAGEVYGDDLEFTAGDTPVYEVYGEDMTFIMIFGQQIIFI
jgi:hypothetical protein